MPAVMRLALAIALFLLPAQALPQDEKPPETWEEYQAAHSLTCVGPIEVFPKPDVREHKGFQYVFLGSTAKVQRIAGRVIPGELRLGVLSGIKELDKETRETIERFVVRFKTDKVEGLVVGGDSAEHETDLEDIFAFLAAFDLPTYVVIGNWEGRAPFNRALRVASRDHPNLINMNLVRRLDAEGVDIVSLGGYLDRMYVKGSGSCVYKPEDARALASIARGANDPVLLLMHGPPRQSGRDAIDFVPGAGNVGDRDVAAAIAEARIPFGIHGHILEAGGRGTDAAGKLLPERKWHKSLFVNPGPVNSLPWRLNGGKTSYGLGAILTLKGKEARYEILHAPKQEGP